MARHDIFLIGCALAGLAVNGWIAFANRTTWDVDFNQYYSAGKLVGSGHLYNAVAILSLEREHNAKTVPFGRIPVFAVAFKPLSAMPYPVARVCWLVISTATLAGFIYLWPFFSRKWVWVAVCWSAPVAMCLSFGQDSILFLFFVALGMRLLSVKRDFWAGLVFSACAAKPHLALMLPVFLIARSKWTALLGGVTSGTTSLIISFAAEGRDWIQRLLALARIPEFDPAAERMPNLRGLMSFFGGSFAIEVALALIVSAAVWFISRRQPLPAAAAVVLAGGLLVGHHAYFYDAVLLLPAVLLPFQPKPLETRLRSGMAAQQGWLRMWAMVLITPAPYLLLLTSAGIAGSLVITGYSLALMAAMFIHPCADETESGTGSLPQY